MKLIVTTAEELSKLVNSAVADAMSKFSDQQVKPQLVAATFGKIPVKEIFEKKIISKPTLYAHVKAGKIKIYKLGGRSYVDAAEFENSFMLNKISKK